MNEQLILEEAKINILLKEIASAGLAVPVCRELLNKTGSVTAKEHVNLLQRFVREMGKSRILGVLADREFASKMLFRWLNKHKVPFYIRIKDNTVVCIRKNKFIAANQLFYSLNPKEQKTFGMTVWIFDEKIYLAGSRLANGELMIVATNQACKNAITLYSRRWEVENLFQNLEEREFQSTPTHLAQQQHIEKWAS